MRRQPMVTPEPPAGPVAVRPCDFMACYEHQLAVWCPTGDPTCREHHHCRVQRRCHEANAPCSPGLDPHCP